MLCVNRFCSMPYNSSTGAKNSSAALSNITTISEKLKAVPRSFLAVTNIECRFDS